MRLSFMSLHNPPCNQSSFSDFEFVQNQFPGRSREDVRNAIQAATDELKSPEDHDLAVQILWQRLN